MIRNKKELLLSALFFFIIAIALIPSLFQEGIPVDERATQNLPDRIFNIRALRQGVIPLWNPCLFWGTPHIATHQSAFFYPPNLILYFLFPPVGAMKISTLVHTFLAGLFMFLYLKRLRIRGSAALAGGLAFMMSGYLLSHECHTANHNSVVWIPLLFFFMEGFLRKRDRLDFLGGTLTFALMIFSGYMHTVVIAAFYVVVYLAFRVILNRDLPVWGSILGILGMLFVGGCLAAVQVLTTRGILDQTVREKITYEVFTRGYFPLSFVPLLFFPYLFGAHYTYTVPTSYCGPHNLHELTGWMDSLFLVLGSLGFFSFKRGKRASVAWSWMVIGVLSFILCFGPENPLYRITFYIPGYNLFMGPAKNWLGVHLAVSVLTGMGLHSLLVLLEKRPRIFRRIAFMTTLALFCLGLLMICFIQLLHLRNVQSWPNFQAPSLMAYISWENPAVWIPISALFFSTLVLFVFAFSGRAAFLLLCLPPLLIQALFLKHNMYIHPFSLENIFKYPENNSVYSFLKNREGDFNEFRVYPVRLFVGDGMEENLYPCINEVYGIRSLAGYGPLFQKDFSELTHIHSTGISYRLEHLIKQNRIFSMLNTKYLVILPSNEEHEKVIGFIENAVSNPGRKPFYKEVFRSPLGVRVYENLYAAPLAYGISRVIIPDELRENPGDIMAYCGWLYKWTTRFDPREEALLMETIPKEFPQEFSQAIVKVKRFQFDRIEMDVEAKGTAFVILSEMFYPGWKAFMDGKPARNYRVNVVMNGLLVPEGNHTIVYRYLPKAFVHGLILSCIFSAVLIMIFSQWNRIKAFGWRRHLIGEKR